MVHSPLHAWPSLQPWSTSSSAKKSEGSPCHIIRTILLPLTPALTSLWGGEGPSKTYLISSASSRTFCSPWFHSLLLPLIWPLPSSLYISYILPSITDHAPGPAHTSPSLPGSLQSTAFPCCLFSHPFHASALHRLASGPSLNLNYDLHVEVATSGHFHPHPINLSAVLDQTDWPFSPPCSTPPGSKISGLPSMSPYTFTNFLVLLPQPIFQCWHMLINYKGKTVALQRESWQVAHQPSNVS